MGDTHSDALVFFGATGDLAYKKIFPVAAGDGQARRPRRAGHRRGQGRLDPRPVARAGAGQRREARRPGPCRVRQAVRTASLRRRRLQGPGDLRGAPASRSETRSTPRTIWRSRHRSSDPSWSNWLESGCAKGARVVVEKPFGQDLASARELNRILLGDVRRARHLPDRPLPRKAPRSQHAVLSLLESAPRGLLESEPRRERADHDGGGLRHPGPRRLLRRDRRDPRRRPEPPLPGAEQPRDGAAGEDGQRVPAGRKGEGPEVHSRLWRPRTSFVDSSAAIARSVASPPIRRSRRSPLSGCASIRGGGRASRSTSAPASASP